MSDWAGWGKLTNLSLFSAQPEEAEERASGTKARDKKFIIKRQQKDLPGHINNNGDNEGKKSTKGWRPQGVALKGFSHYWRTSWQSGTGALGILPWAECMPTCDTFLLLRRIAFVTRALPPLRFNGNRSRANIFRFGSVRFHSFWWGW